MEIVLNIAFYVVAGLAGIAIFALLMPAKTPPPVRSDDAEFDEAMRRAWARMQHYDQ